MRGVLRYLSWRSALMIAALALLVAFHYTDWDLSLSGLFFDRGWADGTSGWMALVYRLGPVPSLAIFAGGLAVLLLSLVHAGCRSLRRQAAFLVLVMIIGPGLVVNVGFKDHFCRARPKEVLAFGGAVPFTPIGVACEPSGLLGRDHIGNSFPSGHSSTGFYLMALYFPLRRRFARGADWAVVAGLALGAVIGLERIAVGAHFASDVLASGVILGLASASCWWLVNTVAAATASRRAAPPSGLTPPPASARTHAASRLRQDRSP